MGGRGSGRSASFGIMVDKCGEYHSIDLAWLRRQKLLRVGHGSRLLGRAGDTSRAAFGSTALQKAFD